MLASFIGVIIVLVAARILIPLRVTAAFWLLGLAASLVGGAAMYAGFEVLGDTTLSNVVGFSVWHVAACLAIHLGRQSNDAESGVLASFARDPRPILDRAGVDEAEPLDTGLILG
jgi:hypothetical protein